MIKLQTSGYSLSVGWVGSGEMLNLALLYIPWHLRHGSHYVGYKPGLGRTVHDTEQITSLETLLQMVSAGIGCTLALALAIKKVWMDDSDLVLKPLDKQSAFRRISLVSRKTFPRHQVLEAFAKVILEHLPASVRSLGS